MSHTPGPWHRNIKPASKYPVIFAGRNTHVAIIETRGLSEAEIEANCDLVKAAPNMLAALKLAESTLRRLQTLDGAQGTLDVIRIALAEAGA